MKKIAIATAAILVTGFLVIQTVNAGPGRTFGPGERVHGPVVCQAGEFAGYRSGLTDEQIAQRQEYRQKVWELRDEYRKDVIDGDRIAELREELAGLRAEMGLPERTERGYRDGRKGRPGKGSFGEHRYGRALCETALTDEQIAQRQEYRQKVRELRDEYRKDAIDGDRIAELREELAGLRAEMGLPGSKRQDLRTERSGRHFHDRRGLR